MVFNLIREYCSVVVVVAVIVHFFWFTLKVFEKNEAKISSQQNSILSSIINMTNYWLCLKPGIKENKSLLSLQMYR